MWTELRKDIEQARKNLKTAEYDFFAVPTDQWQGIQKNIYTKFCNLGPENNVTWFWNFFKLDQYSVAFDYNWPFDELLKLIDPSEKVWLFLNESASKGEKFWFYEGNVKPIVLILKGSYHTDEVYIVSKKYEWLVCVNHHDVIIATGKIMPEKLKQLEKERAKKI
jgi:hypothetical protein